MDDDKKLSFHVPERGIYHAGRLKKYPGGGWELLAASKPIFREAGWELSEGRPLAALLAERSGAQSADAPEGRKGEPEAEAPAGAEDKAASTERAARRAAAKVRDLALCNAFAWFVTLTLDADKVDRYDVREITRKLNHWLDNQVRRHGLKYVLVPERHQDGAIHFHGFVNDGPGFVPSGTWSVPGHKKPIKPRSEAQRREWAARDDCHEVFNWLRWPLGFSTAIRLYGSYQSAVSYVCKYVRKQTDGGKIGGRWYYSGGDLRRPEVELLDFGLSELQSSEASFYGFEIPEAGLSFGMIRGGFDDPETDLTKAGKSNAPVSPGRGPAGGGEGPRE